MTNLKFAISGILLLILTSNSFGQGGWSWYNPLPQGNNLRSVMFIDSNTGFCFGDHGTFLRTTNGGINWSVHQITKFQISSMDFINDQTGYINASAWILKTTDSGLNWFSETSTVHAVFNCMKFLNEMTGFATGAYIYKTTNGGKSWESTPLNVGGLNSVIFRNQNTGFAVGNYTTIIKTTNSGVNWSIVRYSNVSTECYNAIAFADSLNGHIVSSNGSIVSTRDAGFSWNYVTPFTGQSNGIKFIDQNTGIAFGSIYEGSILKTTNKGLNWTPILTSGFSIKGADFTGLSSLIAVYDGGKIFKTTNF
ncbi:MAG: YCF48-related protein, partial [Bacteroidetes bacterium]|nr:YCF48-related protein [Bacteroidota bacterium]